MGYTKHTLLAAAVVGLSMMLSLAAPASAATIYTPQLLRESPEYGAWSGHVLYDKDDEMFYQFIGVMRNSRPGCGLDISRSRDGVHWETIEKNACFVENAVAGYHVKKVGDRYIYYATCRAKGDKYMALYASRDLHNWEVLGDQYDVHPDPKWYQCRMDELHVMDASAPDTGYYGYITSEPHHDRPASFGMLRSDDGIRWRMIAPPEIVWGSIPQQIPEVGFCERIGDKYYLTLGMRCYLGELGYSMFTFTGDAPTGPFFPDKEVFRLCGTTTRDSFYLTFSVHYKDQLLASNWFTNGFNKREHRMLPLKKAQRDEEGHLRLVYWEGNGAMKGDPIRLAFTGMEMEHPQGDYPRHHYSIETGQGRIAMQAGRDGMLVLLPGKHDLDRGLVLEGSITAAELSLPMITHLHPAAAGFYIEETPGQGTALLLETLGITRIGSFAYAEEPITDHHDYSQAATQLVQARSGDLLGTSKFVDEDVTRTIGYATAGGIKKKTKCKFRFLIRDGILECYLDDLLVQTYAYDRKATGRIGLLARDGSVRFEDLRCWQMSY
ncbi:MAG: hypothetical protein ACOY3P_08705 [Planctomycetota bacterium]